MTSASPARVKRILDGAAKDIDAFLDSSVLAYASQEARPAASPASLPSKATAAADTVAPADLAVQFKLEAELQEARLDIDSGREAAENREAFHASTLERLTQEQDQLHRDSRSKRLKADQAEDKVADLQRERDSIARDLEALKKSSQFDLKAVRRKSEAESVRLQDEVKQLRAMMNKNEKVAGSAESPRSGDKVQAMHERIKELETQVKTLQLLDEQAAPERGLAKQLRQRLQDSEEELRTARGMKEEVQSLRARLFSSEQEEASLRKAVDARNRALHELEAVARGAALAKRDLGAFQAAAASCIAETPGGSATTAEGSKPNPLDLSLAWAQCQRELGALRREKAELQQAGEDVTVRERKAHVEVRKLISEKAVVEATVEELQLESKRVADANAILQTRVDTLHEALKLGPRAGAVAAAAATESGAVMEAAVAAANRKTSDAEAIAYAKTKALKQATHELEALRIEAGKLVDTESSNHQLKRTNSELWSANQDLEQQLQVEQQATAEGVGSSVKVLHLLRRPGAHGARTDDQLELDELRREVRLLRASSSASSGDLERRQAIRQLEKFQKATKKFVQNFREGIFGLLGWKVEMTEKNGTLRWQLTSRFRQGDELCFQLKPAGPQEKSDFELLSTPWGEQIQANNEAMAYLEMFGGQGIPGFLAHITSDLLTQQSLPAT